MGKNANEKEKFKELILSEYEILDKLKDQPNVLQVKKVYNYISFNKLFRKSKWNKLSIYAQSIAKEEAYGLI